METSFWAPYISDGTVKAICWTLIHSLWIGLIIALLCGVIIAITRKSAAVLRYRLLCGLLMVFVISMVITFNIEVRAARVPLLPPTPPIIVMTVDAPTVSQQVETVLNRSLVDQTIGFLNQNRNIIFMAWLLFFLLKSLKMVSGLLYIQRIRHHKTHAVADELKHRIELFSSQIGIRRAVRLVQSKLVRVPVAVGWLSPVILLPLGIVFQLTPEQLDGILWHELAHIRRRDYLVNILQGLVETVFFFNPGLLWLSSLIRTEREACCDDIVLSRMNQKANYLEALLSFGYGEFKQANFAMSVGSGKQLRERLKRMISRENKRLGLVEKVVLIAGIVVLSAFAGLRKNNKKYIRQVINAVVEKTTSGMDKMTPAVGAVSHPKKINAAGVDAINNKADTSVHLFDRQYEWSQSEPGITYYLSAEDAAGTKYRFTVTKFKMVALTVNGNDVQKRNLYKYAHLLKHIPPPPPPPPIKPTSPAPPPGASGDKADTLGPVHVGMNSSRADGDKRPELIRQPDKPQEPTPPAPPPSLDKMIADVTNDLINERIIKDKSSLLTIKLTYSELIVNGVKQPDEIQKKFAAKYYPGNARLSKDPNYGLWYNAKTHGVALGTFNIDLDAL